MSCSNMSAGSRELTGPASWPHSVQRNTGCQFCYTFRTSVETIPFIIPYCNVKSAYVSRFDAFGINFHYSCYPAAKKGQFWMLCGLNITHSVDFETPIHNML
jgi:hypothetical protein